MWSSLLVGDEYDSVWTHPDARTDYVLKQLAQHPLFKAGRVMPESGQFGTAPAAKDEGRGAVAPKGIEVEDPVEEERRQKKLQRGLMTLSFPVSGDGWFEHHYGKSAECIVKDLRKRRRKNKEMRGEIDDAIKAVRMMKKLEVEKTLGSLSWSDGHIDTIHSIGLSERDLKSLRRFGETRAVSLQRACAEFQYAADTIAKLAQVHGDWTQDEKTLWSEALQKRNGARTMWRHTLHQSDTLNKNDVAMLTLVAQQLEGEGPMDSRGLLESLHERAYESYTVQKMSALLKTYGLEYDIEKIDRKRWGIMGSDGGILIKDPWAYAAGFLDADGYITITKRGEPRAGIIATGDRGRDHIEQLYKTLECGVKQLDLKIHKNSTRSQHRLQFYSNNDLRKLIKGTLPHLHLKKKQAAAVLEHLDLRGQGRESIIKQRDALFRIVKWENWKDVPHMRVKLLDEWNVDEEIVSSW